MVQFDASTPTKFSQHLIFPSVVFQDIFHAGFFVSYLCQRVTNSYEQNQPSERSSLLEKLLVRKKEDSHSVLFVDQGVYTKNRNFRLFKSSKLKKNNPLVLTVDCPLQEKTEREIFFINLQ
jgi:DNA-directed primase/polymerase protein